ncbi:MAG TPA: FAD-dependent oxidoreductase [Nitrososphaerales archaeon]|nr:FAD-dependent oxidoreductase [Nitrososphaerales archaeon]
MPKVVVVGAGFGGISAAAVARNAGADVTLVERTDQLLGVGLHSGIFYNDGRQAGTEELKALGGGWIVDIIENPPVLLYPRTDMNWSAVDDLVQKVHATAIFHCMKAETHIRKYLRDIGVELIFANRAVDVEVGKAQNAQGDLVLKVVLEKGQRIEADAFVDGTGGAGGIKICKDYGYGCVECMLRCNSFGDRVSIATKAGAPELRKIRDSKHGGGFGGLSSACSFYDDSIAPELMDELKREGSVKIPVPEEVRDMTKIGLSTNLPYDPSHVKSVKVAYPGFFKVNGLVFMPLEDVRKLKGMEDARYSDPLGGGVGNAVRFMSMAPRDDALRVIGFRNLFVAGEKGGPNVGIQECMVTGALAGYNAARVAFGWDPMALPRETVIGSFVSFVGEQMKTEKGLTSTYSMTKPPFRTIMGEKGWWAKTVPAAVAEAKARVEKAGLTGMMAKTLAPAPKRQVVVTAESGKE